MALLAEWRGVGGSEDGSCPWAEGCRGLDPWNCKVRVRCAVKKKNKKNQQTVYLIMGVCTCIHTHTPPSLTPCSNFTNNMLSLKHFHPGVFKKGSDALRLHPKSQEWSVYRRVRFGDIQEFTLFIFPCGFSADVIWGCSPGRQVLNRANRTEI